MSSDWHAEICVDDNYYIGGDFTTESDDPEAARQEIEDSFWCNVTLEWGTNRADEGDTETFDFPSIRVHHLRKV